MSNNNKKQQYGIYLGNEYSGIAVNGKIIANQRIKKQTMIPTVVSFDNDRKDPIIGENIKFQLESNPKNTIYGFLKLIGKNFLILKFKNLKRKLNLILKKKVKKKMK